MRLMPMMTFAAVCLFAGAAHAADETGKWYVNPMWGYTWLDNVRSVDDGDHWALGVGKHLSEHWSLELNALRGDFDNEAGLELKQTALSLDALVVFARPSIVSPYLTFGTGYIDQDYHPGAGKNGVLAQAGAGLMIDVGQNAAKTFVFQLRPEAKLRYDWAGGSQHDNLHDYLVNLGFVFNFGPAPYVPPPPTPPAPPPPPPPPPPAIVDSDGDGVLDPQDQCPGTPRGVVVDALGCPRKGSVTLRSVNFEFNSATLTADSHTELDQVADDLKKHPHLKVEMQGHTDSVGKDAYNMQLSEKRAASVREYLIAQGVDPANVTAKGYGETQPIADNKTDSGRAENRRVEMLVTDNPGDIPIKEEPK